MRTINLPDLGEGLAESEIVKWHISVGDMVKLDQVVLTVCLLYTSPSPRDS